MYNCLMTIGKLSNGDIMALPKLNDQPKYELVIPSTQQKIRFRPFLVKEEKVLLLAMESNDQNLILASITDTIEACVIDKIDAAKLTTFDIEYVFTQIRSRSVGEVATVLVNCSECETPNELKIPLDAITVTKSSVSNMVKLTDSITLELQYPSYKTITADSSMLQENAGAEATFKMIKSCMKAVLTEDERVLMSEEDPESVDAFLNSMTTSQLDEIRKFIEDMPNMYHNAEYTCTECAHDNKLTLEGMQSFF